MASNVQRASMSRAIAPVLLVSSMVFVAILYVNAQYPNLLSQLGVGTSTTTAPINSAEAREATRLTQINALLISARNKQDLRDGRPFWGAATHMVELAFRGPADDVILRSRGERLFEFHRYGFGGLREPVVMEFQDNSLNCVHYPQRTRTACAAGLSSFYAGQPFPFSYEVSIGN